ncbi:RDD family protein [Cellulomonas sp. zg-ZUI22]|uniref:RDD family protein n=1 Tax=Cellulomonas sp. zg-ZUI22 TaxID=2816955 RepID=UPI001A93AAF9|nr:RDD family protein [Cellulomonas sp. zg-ZUI22]MBO0899421.1 RDD family protein [Cellulomonas sp. zg-ZUI22]
MTVTDVDPSTRVTPRVPEVASWGRRVIAALLDGAVLGAVAWLVGGDRIAAPSLQPTFDTGTDADLLPWTSSAVVVTAVVLMLVLQGLTGQTPGRRVVRLQVVRAPADGPVGGQPGVLRSVVRCWAHLLDAILLIGYLRPLWHPEGRTFADSLVGTAVVLRPPRSDGLGRAVTAAAWVVIVVGLVLGVRLGDAGGVTRDSSASCRLETQDADAPLRVDRVTLVREIEWRQAQRLWPWQGDARRAETTRLALEVAWRPTGPHEPGSLLVRTTTSDGATVENAAWSGDGPMTTFPLEGAAPVDVEVLFDGRTLTTCTATLLTGG